MSVSTADVALSEAIGTAAREATRERAQALAEDEAITWLKALDERIWKVKYPPHVRPPRAERSRWEIESLTLEDWDMFATLAPRFPTVAHNAWCHFGFGLTLCSFPATPGAPSETVCTVNTSHMPKEVKLRLAQDIGFDMPRTQSDYMLGWELFSPITHRDQNRGWAKLYKLPTPQTRTHYDY